MRNYFTLLLIFIITLSARADEPKAKIFNPKNTQLENRIGVLVVSNPTFVFNSGEAYNNGGSILELDVVTVLNTLFRYDIDVRASSSVLNHALSSASIPVSNFQIRAVGAGGNNIGWVTLSSSNQKLVDEAPVVLVTAIWGLEYRTFGGADFLNKPAGNYTTNLVFTISTD